MYTDLAYNWAIWGPAHMINFAFCPMHYRVPFVALVSLGWTMILSFMRGDEGLSVEDEPSNEDDEGDVTPGDRKLR